MGDGQGRAEVVEAGAKHTVGVVGTSTRPGENVKDVGADGALSLVKSSPVQLSIDVWDVLFGQGDLWE